MTELVLTPPVVDLGAYRRKQFVDWRFGRWQNVMADVELDALISDSPFDEATHDGAADEATGGDGSNRVGVAYEPWTRDHVVDFVNHWSPRVRGWIAMICADTMIDWWKQAYRDAGRYAFQDVPIVVRGMGVRLLGDGPSSWGLHLMVARPRTKLMASWGTLDGGYCVPAESDAQGGRGKPLRLIRAIVRDYSRPGDLVGDPLGGYATTLIAARSEGRSAIGCEEDKSVFLEGQRRVGKPVQMGLF